MQNLTITVDDTSPIFHYSPSSAWFSAIPQENANLTSYFQNTATYTNVSQANVTFEFWGNSIQIFGSKSQNHGNFRVQIDDQVFDPLSGHSNSPGGFQEQLFGKSGLLCGKHTVVMTNIQEGMFVDIDFVTWETDIDDGDEGIVRLDTIQDDSQAIVYSGSWDSKPSHLDTFFGGTGRGTKQPGASLEFTFTGTALAIFGPADPNGAPYTVQVGNSTLQKYSFHTSRYVPQSLLFFQGNMSVEEHTVKVTHAGTDSNENNTLAIDFMNVYSPSTYEIRMTAAGGGTSSSTVAAVIMGVIAGLLLLFIAMIYVINRGRKLGQFEWNIFNRDSWGFNKKNEVTRRVRREDVTEGFELDGGGYASVMTSEMRRTGRNEPATTRSAASVTSGDGSEMGLISQRRNEISEVASGQARPNKQRWSFSGLSVLSQPLVIPKTSMGIIGMDGAPRQLSFPSGQSGQRNSAVSASIPLPPGLAGTSRGGSGDSNRRETVLSWKPEPEDSQSQPSGVPPPLPLSQTSQPKSEDSHHSSPVRFHHLGSEGSLPLRSALPEPDARLPPLPSPSPSSIGQTELLLHRTPMMPASPSGIGGSLAHTTETVETSEMLTPTSGLSERSSTSIEISRSRRSSYVGGGLSPRSGRERPRSVGSILGPRMPMRTPKTPPPNYPRGGSSSGKEKEKKDGEAL